MAKMNWTRVTKEVLCRTRGVEFADIVVPPRDNYIEVPVTLGGNMNKNPPKRNIVRRRPNIKQQYEASNNSKFRSISILNGKIEHIAKKILRADRRQKPTCHSLYMGLIAGIKELVAIDPLRKDTPLSKNIIAAIEKISKL